MPRFFITGSNIFGGIAYLDAKDAEHLKVLRVRQGESVTICDGNGTDYKCVIRSRSENGAEAEILEVSPSLGEASVSATVYIALAKGDRNDFSVQKCVELGADEIVLFPSERCIVKLDPAHSIKKTDRWQRIAEEAAKQCGRGRIPQVRIAPSYEAAIEEAAGKDLPMFFYEDEHDLSLKTVLDGAGDIKTASIVTGPEGGFEPEEAEYAASRGMKVITMGHRILRCETAPLCALSALMLSTGNL